MNRARTVQIVADVMEPQHFAIRRVQKWDMKSIEVERIRGCAARVSLRLNENVLWAKTQLLGFYDGQDATVRYQHIIGGAVIGGVFLGGVIAIRGHRPSRVEGNDLPALRFQPPVNSPLASFRLPFFQWSRDAATLRAVG